MPTQAVRHLAQALDELLAQPEAQRAERVRQAIQGFARLEPDAGLRQRLVSLEHGALAYVQPAPRQRFGEQRIACALQNNLRAIESTLLQDGCQSGSGR